MFSFPPLLPDMLESTVAGFGLERPMVGIHIRRTDKVSRSLNIKQEPTLISKKSGWHRGSIPSCGGVHEVCGGVVQVGQSFPFDCFSSAYHVQPFDILLIQALRADAYLEDP